MPAIDALSSLIQAVEQVTAATKGPWSVLRESGAIDDGLTIVANDSFVLSGFSPQIDEPALLDQRRNDVLAAAAAVNFIRDHGAHLILEVLKAGAAPEAVKVPPYVIKLLQGQSSEGPKPLTVPAAPLLIDIPVTDHAADLVAAPLIIDPLGTVDSLGEEAARVLQAFDEPFHVFTPSFADADAVRRQA